MSSSRCEFISRRGTPRLDDPEYQNHLKECKKCRATEQLLTVIGEDRNDSGAVVPLDDLAARKLVDSAIEDANELRKVGLNTKPRLPIVKISVGIAAAIILAVFGVWVVWQQGKAELKPQKQLVPPPKTEAPSSYVMGSRFALLSGEVFMGSSPATADGRVVAGSTIKTGKGRSVISLPYGITMSLKDDTNLTVVDNDKGRVNIGMSSGNVLFALDPKRKHRGLSIETHAGKIRVTGTVFTVESGIDEVIVHLHRGQLAITHKDGKQEKIEGEQSIALGTSKRVPVPDVVTLQMRALADELLELGLGDHLESFAQLEKEVVDAGDGSSRQLSSGRKPRPSLSDLMTSARTYKLQGNYKEAASIYEEIIDRFSESRDAATSLVSLGQLNLEKLNTPKDAVRAFDKYLRRNPGGALSQEALYGRAKAFRKIGDKSKEIAALEKLIETHPTGIHSERVKKRLADLKN